MTKRARVRIFFSNVSHEIGYSATAGTVRRKKIDGSTVQPGEIFVLLLMC